VRGEVERTTGPGEVAARPGDLVERGSTASAPSTRSSSAGWIFSGTSPSSVARKESAQIAGVTGIGLGAWDYLDARRSGSSETELRDDIDDHRLRVIELELLRGWWADADARGLRLEEDVLLHLAGMTGAEQVNVGLFDDVRTSSSGPPRARSTSTCRSLPPPPWRSSSTAASWPGPAARRARIRTCVRFTARRGG
jgi:sugar phosphate isomerase/epimerase